MVDCRARDQNGSMDVEQKTQLSVLTTVVSFSQWITLTCSLFVFQHFHRLFLRETETGNTGASENLERAGHSRRLEECVAAIQ